MQSGYIVNQFYISKIENKHFNCYFLRFLGNTTFLQMIDT